MGRMEAALLGAKQIAFTVVSISLSLIAVFIPLLFMPGIIGKTGARIRLYAHLRDPHFDGHFADGDADALRMAAGAKAQAAQRVRSCCSRTASTG